MLIQIQAQLMKLSGALALSQNNDFVESPTFKVSAFLLLTLRTHMARPERSYS